jgi:uncharacterized protein
MRLPDRDTLFQHLPPDWILQEICNQYTLDPAGLHGLNHWGRVYENGITLSLQQGGDQKVISFFSVFHDACRINQAVDPGHGSRAADLAYQLLGSNRLLSPSQLDQLLYACRFHTAGRTEGDLTVQICWDSDRLDLFRAGIYPEADYLCTPSAKDDKFIRWAVKRSSADHVSEIIREVWKPIFLS